MRSGTQSVERAFAILKAVGDANATGVTLQTVMQAVRLNRTTAYRMLRCLMQQRAVRLEPASARYFLGPLALELGISARQHVQFKDVLAPTLTRIAEATADTVFLLLRSGSDSVCIDRRLGAYPIKTIVVEVGTRRPLGVGAAGVAILQGLSSQASAQIVRENAERYALFDTTAASVLKTVQAAKKLGHVSTRVHGVPGVTAIALPILDARGNAIAALAVAAIAQRMSRPRQAELVQIVRAEIRQVELLLRDSNVEAH